MSIEERIEDILRQYAVFNFRGGHTVRQNMAHAIVEELELTEEFHENLIVEAPRFRHYITPWERIDE